MKFDQLTVKPCLTSPSGPPCGGIDRSGPGGGSKGGGPPPPVPCCADPEFAASNPIICPIDDPRCSDPAFAAANPLLCPNSPRLILKPAYAQKDTLQQVAYGVVLLNGGKESEVTGASFRVANGAIAQIGGASGKLTTLAPGLTMVAADWGGLHAYGQLVVLDDGCASRQNDFLLVIDNSKSMSVAFSAMFASKLTFAKAQAKEFLASMDLSKDRAAVLSFNSSTTLRQDFSQDLALLNAAVDAIAPSSAQTNLKAAIVGGAALLNGDTAAGDTQAMLLFSDGENKVGGNPLPEATAFQGAGGILMICGVRAYNGGFTLLDEMASGGFFVNAYQDVEDRVADWLAGMKGYLCSGFCAPPGDVCVPYAQLDYNAFEQWDVTGRVDLIGDGGRPLFDILPGHGLYVDLCGSSSPWKGGLVSKQTFDFVEVPTYRVRLKLAGNQRQDIGPWTVRVRLGAFIDQVVTVDDWKQDFTEYSWEFQIVTPGSARLEILTESVPSGAAAFYGLLLDDVYLEKTANGDYLDTVVMLGDDFNNENKVCFPPTGCTPAPCPVGQPIGNLEVRQFHDAITENGGTMSDADLCAHDEFVTSLKDALLWDKLGEIGTLAGDQVAAAQVKLKTLAGAHRLLGLNGFTDADYAAHGPAGGFQGGGANQFIDTHVYPGTFVGQRGSMFFWARTDPGTFGSMIGVDDTDRSDMLGQGGGVAEFWWDSSVPSENGLSFGGRVAAVEVNPPGYLDWSGATDAPHGNAVVTGLWAGLGLIEGSHNLELYRNGQKVGSRRVDTVEFAIPDQTFYLFGNDDDGLSISGNLPWAGLGSFYALGDSTFTADDMAAFYRIVRKLHQRLDRLDNTTPSDSWSDLPYSPEGGYSYGYCMASGCLDQVFIPAQLPDPSPSTDVEPCLVAPSPASDAQVQLAAVMGSTPGEFLAGAGGEPILQA